MIGSKYRYNPVWYTNDKLHALRSDKDLTSFYPFTSKYAEKQGKVYVILNLYIYIELFFLPQTKHYQYNILIPIVWNFGKYPIKFQINEIRQNI